MTVLSIKPFTNGIVVRMFFDTADQNYIGSRQAYFEERDLDFWWLALHALEKYLKSILLMNGASAKGSGHNIIGLLDRVRAVDQRLTPPPLAKPQISVLSHWPAIPDAKFTEHFNNYGSADSRYGTYGYNLRTADLLKVDQLIFWARRHARLHKQRVSDAVTIDWIEVLANNPEHWLQHCGPLEKVAALRPQDRRRWPLTRLTG